MSRYGSGNGETQYPVRCPRCGWRTCRIATQPSDPSSGRRGREFGFGVCKHCPGVELVRLEPRLPGGGKLAQGQEF